MKQAKDDVLDYSLAQGTIDEQHDAIHVLYSQFGADVGGQLNVFAPAEISLALAGAGVSHVDADAMPEQSPPAAAKLPAAEPAGIVPASCTRYVVHPAATAGLVQILFAQGPIQSAPLPRSGPGELDRT